MQMALDKVRELRGLQAVHITDRKVFHELITTWSWATCSSWRVTTVSALARRRAAAYAREDYPQRDDANWLKHTLACVNQDGIQLSYKPVVITRFQPKERVY
jgi:succinate dehydrogenase / fumarate reductase flavoprotein subunit